VSVTEDQPMLTAALWFIGVYAGLGVVVAILLLGTSYGARGFARLMLLWPYFLLRSLT
jgi:hypothetical protein